MFRLPSIKKSSKTSVWDKKQPPLRCLEGDSDSIYSIYDFKLAMNEILEVMLKEKLGDKYQELEDSDEALAYKNKYSKAMELGLFNNFHIILQKIYNETRFWKKLKIEEDKNGKKDS